jgi:eukaryotic-like serine/threonine-protein kinase
MTTPDRPDEERAPSVDPARASPEDVVRGDTIRVGDIQQSEGVAIGANARATAIKYVFQVFGQGPSGPAFISIGLIMLLGLTSLLLAISVSVPTPSPYLGPLALVFGTSGVGLGIVQYRLSRPPPQLERNRVPLLRRVRRWVSDQLDAAFAGVLRIELNLVACPDALVQPYEDQEPAPTTHAPLPPGISRRFDESSGSLLILGNPGSGKTTLLLELARDLIARAEQDVQMPIPVVFKLSSWDAPQWQNQSPSLFEWLVHELDNQYEVARDLARALIADDQLLPLLDGLDDVRTLERREACAQAINVFHREHHLTRLVVTCRSAEYADLVTRLRLDDAIEVQPPTEGQIDAYLDYLGAPLAGLRAAVTADAALRELVSTPLILAILAQIYRDAPATPLVAESGEGSTDTAALYRRLFSAYIDQMMNRRTSVSFDRTRTMDWLVTLARGMLQNAQQVFLIERLQPNWLETTRDRVSYVLLDRAGGGLIVALAVGLIAGISYGLSFGLGTEWRSGLFTGLANGARFGLVAGLVIALLGRTSESLGQVSTRYGSLLRRAMLGTLVFGTLGGLFALVYLQWLASLLRVSIILTVRDVLADVLFFALVGALGGALVYGPNLGPRIVRVVENRLWSWSRGLPVAVAVGIAVALVSIQVYGHSVWLVFGLVYGLSVWILLGLIAGEVESVARPNQGIRRSARSATRVGLAVGLVSGLGGIFGGLAIGEPRFGLAYGLSSAALVGLFGAIVSGLYACLSHIALRLVLWRSGTFPWDVEAFLDDAAQRILLRRAGGGYTFIHRLLLEYIAGLPRSTDTHEHGADP